jgi:cobaltochelatase CobS
MDRFCLCEMKYPRPELETDLLAKIAQEIPSDIRSKMVEYANEVRDLFMGSSKSEIRSDSILDITFSTRTLIRWAKLTVKFQNIARLGVSPINYALDRALALRASQESRAFLHELSQRIFSSEPLTKP